MSVGNHEKIIQILQNSEDGNKLAPVHLAIIEHAANHRLSEEGWAILEQIHEDVVIKKSYVPPWLHNVEFLRIDHQGFVFWRNQDKAIEHFSGKARTEPKAAQRLGRRCLWLEAQSIPVNPNTTVWSWEEQAGPDKPE